jgi:hypothetical protein
MDTKRIEDLEAKIDEMDKAGVSAGHPAYMAIARELGVLYGDYDRIIVAVDDDIDY